MSKVSSGFSACFEDAPFKQMTIYKYFQNFCFFISFLELKQSIRLAIRFHLQNYNMLPALVAIVII